MSTIKIRALKADSSKNKQKMRIEHSSKRLMVIDENREQREDKKLCSMRSESHADNREQKEKKILLQ